MPPHKRVCVSEMRKRDILNAAFELFIQKGLQATSMAEIAKMANVSTSHLYNFFDNKASIALAVEKQLNTEVTEMFQQYASAGKAGEALENQGYDCLFDSKRWSWVLSFMTEGLRTQSVRDQFVSSDKLIQDLHAEYRQINSENMEEKIAQELAISLFFGVAIRRIFIKDIPNEALLNAVAKATENLLKK